MVRFFISANDTSSKKNRVHFNDSVAVSSAQEFKPQAVINEQKIDRYD